MCGMEAKRQWDDIFEVLKEKAVELEFHIQRNYALKKKKKKTTQILILARPKENISTHQWFSLDRTLSDLNMS